MSSKIGEFVAPMTELTKLITSNGGDVTGSAEIVDTADRESDDGIDFPE